jgi:hypothetical protein
MGVFPPHPRRAFGQLPAVARPDVQASQRPPARAHCSCVNRSTTTSALEPSNASAVLEAMLPRRTDHPRAGAPRAGDRREGAAGGDAGAPAPSRVPPRGARERGRVALRCRELRRNRLRQRAHRRRRAPRTARTGADASPWRPAHRRCRGRARRCLPRSACARGLPCRARVPTGRHMSWWPSAASSRRPGASSRGCPPPTRLRRALRPPG